MQLAELPQVDPRHIDALRQYSWPGNVRELSNVLERSLILWTGGIFEPVLPTTRTGVEERSFSIRYKPGQTVREITDEVKTFMCAAALEETQGNKKAAAKLLNISRDAFYRYSKHMHRIPENKTRE